MAFNSSSSDFSNKDFLPYLSPINGDDNNDGFARSLPISGDGTTQNPTVFSGTSTTVETAGGITPLAMTPSDPNIIGKELRLIRALVPLTVSASILDRQCRRITANTVTGFTVSPAFAVPPAPGDTFVVVSPIKTFREMLKRIPPMWGKLSQIDIASENGPVQTGPATASVIGIVSAFGAPVPVMRISGMGGLSAPASIGNVIALGGAVREALRATSPSPTPGVAALTGNNGFFEITGVPSASVADVRNFDAIILSGSAASIVAGAPAGQMRVTGLTGMVAGHVGKLLNVSNALAVNSGLFTIVTINSATSVDVTNASAVIPDPENGFIQWMAASSDANNGSISWCEYQGLVGNSNDGGIVGDLIESGMPLSRSDGVQALTLLGNYTDELCGVHTTPTAALNTTATGTTSGVLVITGGLGLPTATIGVPTTLTAAQLPPAGGQVIPGFTLVAGSQIGRQLLMTTGAAKGTMSEIVANDTTSVTVSPPFSLTIAAGDKCIVDFFGQKVLMVTGPAIGQRRVITGGLQGNIANVTAILGGVGVNEATITGLTGMTAADVGASILFRGMTNGANNGLFVIASFISAVSVTVINAAAVVESPGTGNWMVVGGVSIGVNAPFSSAPTAGGTDQFRIERAGSEYRGGWLNGKAVSGLMTKALKVISNTAASGGPTTAHNIGSDEGTEYALRNANININFSALAAAPNLNQVGVLGNKNPFSPLNIASARFIHGGNLNVQQSGNYAQFLFMSNGTATFDLHAHVVGGLQSVFTRQVTVQVRGGSMFNIAGNAVTRSRMDVSKSTVATVGIIDIAQAQLGDGSAGPCTNCDVLNGAGHGINVGENSMANVSSVGGTGHAGYGISCIRSSSAQVRTATTTLTGALGQFGMAVDVAASSSVATTAALSGLPAGQVGINNSQGSTIVSSTTTAATSTVLTDGVATYVVNEFRGQVLRYTSGPAAGQQRVIVSNTLTTVITGAAFSPDPTGGGGDTYRIETNEPSGCRVEKVSP